MASIKWILALPIGLLPTISLGDFPDSNVHLDLTHTWAGYFALTTITLAYIFAMLEDVTYLRKSKPMLLGASMIWIAILVTYRQHGGTHIAVNLNPCLISPKEPLNNSGFLPVKPEWGRFFQFSGSKARGLAHG